MWDKINALFFSVIIHCFIAFALFLTIKQSIKIEEKPVESLKSIMQAVTIDESQWKSALQNSHSKVTNQQQELKIQYQILAKKEQLLATKVSQQEQQLRQLQQSEKNQKSKILELKKRQINEILELEVLKFKQIEKKRLKQAELEKQLFEIDKRRKQEESYRLATAIEQARNIQAQKMARLEENKLLKLIQETIINIKNKIEDKWERPRGYYKGLSCKLEIQLKIGGEVKAVFIKINSGNQLFDNSSRRAVYAASPLPIPNEIFQEFTKEPFLLIFKP